MVRWSDKTCLLSELKEYTKSKDLEGGKKAHTKAVDTGLIRNTHVANAFINMYGRCGSMQQAKYIFDSMSQRDVVSWTSLLQGYVENGQSKRALELFDAMDVSPDSRTYVAAITACAALAVSSKENTGRVHRDLVDKGKMIHSRAVSERSCNIFVESVLVDMYAKFSNMVSARRVFDNMFERNVVSWTALIQGYVDNGESELALQFFYAMLEAGGDCSPNTRTYVAALSACAALAERKDGGWLQKGEAIHARAVNTTFSNIFVENMLVNLYARSGDMVKARRVFQKMEKRNVVSWNCLLQGFVDSGENEVALELFDSMERQGCIPDARTYVAALTACVALATKNKAQYLERGKAIHTRATSRGCCNAFVQTMLVKLFATCNNMELARGVFDQMTRRNAVAWNCLLQGYGDAGENEVVLDLFQRLKQECNPDGRTYVVLLTACASEANKDLHKWLDKGRELHSLALTNQRCDVFVENALVYMYSRCQNIVHARVVFDGMVQCDVVSWTVLLQGYVENEMSDLALKLFEGSMACQPDERAYVVALSACAHLASISAGELNSQWVEKARALHSHARETGCCDTFVWNSLVKLYVDNEESELALELVNEMHEAGVPPNWATFVAALKACGNLMALESGELFHGEIKRCGLEENTLVATCLVDFYGKCGSMEAAKEIFDSISPKETSTWNILMCGYSQQGDAARVFELFEEMKRQGTCPDEITFTLLLTVCSHAGLTSQGEDYFSTMTYRYGVAPNLIHFTCMVDLLARANHLEQALKVVRNSPFRQQGVMWTSILSACGKWSNVKVGALAYESLLKLDDRDDVAYVLMANIYAGLGMREEFENVLASRKLALSNMLDC